MCYSAQPLTDTEIEQIEGFLLTGATPEEVKKIKVISSPRLHQDPI
jgi:hypothetical protein